MRIRPADLPPPRPISHAIVCCDEYHRATFGLSDLGSECILVDNLDDLVASAAAAERFVVIDSRPEALLEALERLAEVLTADKTVQIVAPGASVGLVEMLLGDPGTDRWSLIGLRCDPQVLHCEVVPSRDADRSGVDLARGLRWGSVASYPPDAVDDRDEVQVLRARLASALLLVRDLTAGAPVTLGVPPRAPSGDEAGRRALENRLVSLQRQLDVLQRKYDALAGSRLGRMTLDRWERKRKQANG